MKEKSIKAFRAILFLATAIFLLFLAFRDVSLEELISGLRSANYFWVLLSLAFASMALVSRTHRWILLIEPLGHKPSAKNTFYALMTGYLANFVLPRIGEITRCGSLNRTDRVPVDYLLGTVVTERISDLLVLLLLGTWIFFARIGFFGDFIYDNIAHPLYLRALSWLDFSLFIYIFAILCILFLILFYRVISVWLKRFSLFRKILKITASVFDGVRSVMRMEKKLLFILHTLFIWIMYYLMTWAVFMALPSTSGLGGYAVLFILVIGGFGMAAPVQGGIGAYHWIVSVGLGLYGIPRDEGLVFATLSHESQALLMLLLGSYSLYMVFKLSGKSSARSLLTTNINNTDNQNGHP